MIRAEAKGLVDATPGAVWDVLTDASNYEAWDSGVIRLAGQARDGSCITVRARRGRSMRIHIRMVPRTIRWEHRGPLGLFKAARTCTLRQGDGQTQLTVTEEFAGLGIFRRRTAFSGSATVLESFIRAAKSRAELLGRTWHGKRVGDDSAQAFDVVPQHHPEERRTARATATQQASLRFGP